MGLVCVVPSKGRSVYAQAELRKCVLEIGRTFGIVQCDPEDSLKLRVTLVDCHTVKPPQAGRKLRGPSPTCRQRCMLRFVR